jgi:hypothetical protein
MTRQEWIEEAERYQEKIDETNDEGLKEHYTNIRNACLDNSRYGDEGED